MLYELKMMLNKKKIFVLFLCTFLLMLVFWCVMQCSTNSVVKQIENAILDGTYYSVSDTGNELSNEERLLLKESSIIYSECTYNQMFDDYKIFFSPTCGISVAQCVSGYEVTDIDIHRTYTLHNFKEGYIWVVIHYSVKDKNGNLISNCNGGPSVGVKFKIVKKHDEWHIIHFSIRDNYESFSEQYSYFLPFE